MNKYIKRLCESFFDDIDDDIINTDHEEQVAQKLTKVAQTNLLLEKCTTNEMVCAKLDDEYNVTEWLNNMLPYLKQVIQKGTYVGIYDPGSHIVRKTNELMKKRDFSYFELSYKNYPNTYEYTIHVTIEIIDNEVCIFNESYYDHPKCPILKIVETNQTRVNRVVDIPININDVINAIFPVDKIVEQNVHKPITYQISQKDIDRMTKVYRTQKWAGFTAITKLDKLIPRYAAYFTVRNKTLEYDAPTLLKFIFNKLDGEDENNLIVTKCYLKDIVATVNNN